jgi:hypothetical protein
VSYHDGEHSEREFPLRPRCAQPGWGNELDHNGQGFGGDFRRGDEVQSAEPVGSETRARAGLGRRGSGGLLISPLLLLIALLIKLDSPDPALCGHRRLGATDSYYLCNWVVWLDILARTVTIIERGRGAY